MKRPTRIAVAVAALVAALGGGGAVLADAGGGMTVAIRAALGEVPGGPTTVAPVRIDTTLYIPSTATRSHPAPAVVVSPGFGQSKTAVDADARDLAAHGYVVLAWSLRGFGRSTGRIALDAPDTEVKDLTLLIDRLAQTPEVLQDGPGDPRVGLAGPSYGGGISLMGATYDRRVDATVPIITWNSLNSAFLPGGVFKAQYASVFFASGPGGPCARFAQRVCEAYTRLAQPALAPSQTGHCSPTPARTRPASPPRPCSVKDKTTRFSR